MAYTHPRMHAHTQIFRSESKTLSCVSALPFRDDFDMCFYGISWNRILHSYYERGPPMSLIRSLLFFCIIPAWSTSVFIFLLVGSLQKHVGCCLQSTRSLTNLIRFVHFNVSALVRCENEKRFYKIFVFTKLSVYSYS